MNYIPRNQSVLTDKKKLRPLFTFKNFPVFIGCTDQPQSTDILADLSFAIEPNTGLIQLDKVLPQEIVYSQYHSEAIGKTWTDHHLALVNFISQFHPNNILEIGGSNGFIGTQFLTQNPNSTWTIVEPNPSPDINPKIKVIAKPFNQNFSVNLPNLDAIVHSHVFEHMYHPKVFLNLISNLLSPQKYHLFSVPNLYEWLKNKYTNCLNFEHTIFLTEYFIDYLLSLYGFSILKKENFNNHSLFYATQKGEPYPFNLVSKYDEYSTLFNDYIQSLQQKVDFYNQKITPLSEKVFLFGAHVFSQVLLNLGLKEDKIKNILDNSQLKQEKRLYGYSLTVKSPEVIKNYPKPTVILNAGTYQQEITNQLLQINPQAVVLT